MKKMIALSALFSCAMVHAMENSTWAQRVSSPILINQQQSAAKSEQLMSPSSSSPVSPVSPTTPTKKATQLHPVQLKDQYVIDPSEFLDWRTQLRLEAKKNKRKKNK
jgi:hypothetical protein